jgi:hypothetical protein
MTSGVGKVTRRRRLLRLTGLGFVVGSALFAVGVPLSLTPALPLTVGAAVFFAGSIFFTAAASLQLVLSTDELPARVRRDHESSWFAHLLRPRTVDWTASAIQLAGTLWFNVTTFLALQDAAGTGDATAQAVWKPDAYGSIAFLVSSALAFAPEVRRRRHGHVRDRSWAIGALNLVGSVFFGLSAVGAYTLSSTDELLSSWWSNVGTFAGAICFLVGAVLLIPRAPVPEQASRLA